MLPPRLSVLTLNAWGTTRLAERTPALDALMRRFDPDLVALQEAPPAVLDAVADSLPDHDRAPTADAEPIEIALLWRREACTCLERGAIALPHLPARRPLLWARLRLSAPQRDLVFATAHFTWPGHADERATGRSPRQDQARAAAEALARLAGDAPILFTGDFNESVHPRRILREAGLVDCFTALGLPCDPTRPAPPFDDRPAEVDDWIVASPALRPCAAQVLHFRHQGLPASDHWPVAAVYTIG